MDVITATTIKPYIPKITVIILPTTVVATTSPKPIVVTTAKLYHNASPNVLNPASGGSTACKTMEKQTIMVNKPKMISSENVETIIFAKTLTLSDDKAIREASQNDTIAMKTHSIVITAVTSNVSVPVDSNKPMAKKIAKAIIKAFRIIFLRVCFLIMSKTRDRTIVKQYNPAVNENKNVLSTANNVVIPIAILIPSNTKHLMRFSFVRSLRKTMMLINPTKINIQTRYLGASA